MTRKQKRVLVAKAIRATVAVMGLVGFFVMFASVGSFEQDLIGFKHFIIQSVIGLAMMFVAVEISNECF